MAILVIIDDPDQDRELVDRAQAFARGNESDIVLLTVATPAEYEDAAETLETIGRTEHTSYSEDAVLNALSGNIDDALGKHIVGGKPSCGFSITVTKIVEQSGHPIHC